METLGFSVKAILSFTILVDTLLILLMYSVRQNRGLRALFLIHLLGILGWAISILVVLQTENYAAARFSFICALIFAVAKYYFALIFPGEKFVGNFWSYIPLLLSLAVMILAGVPGMVFHTITVVDGYYITIDTGPLSAVYSLLVTFFLTYPIYILARKYYIGRYGAHIREQLKYLCIGTTLFFAISLSTNSILPVFFNIYFFNGLGPAFSLFLVSFIFYIISRHHFLGLRLILQRGFIYSVLFFFIVSFYLSIITLTGFFLQQITQTAIIINAGITTLLGIFTVPHIDRYLRRKTDAFFFKDSYNYADALYELSEKIHASVLIEDIEKLTQETLSRILKTKSVKMSLHEESALSTEASKKTDQERKTLTVPIIFEGNIAGNIFLGEKRSGDPYSDTDIALLKTFSHQAASAFQKAKLFSEVEAYSKELEKRVEDRTAQIIHMQKQQQQMMLDISHKLQSPLTVVKTQLSHMRKSAAHTDDFTLFEHTIDDISAFVYDLLHLSQLQTLPSGSVAKHEHSLSEHVEELAEYFELMAKEKGIGLSYQIQDGINYAYNKPQITELLTNLVSNAVKYTDPKKEEQTASISLERKGAHIFIKVSDNGLGIPQQDLPHIFTRFYRTELTREIKGTGLGLAICKTIVEIHNGTISVESELKKGTTIIISLPS